MDQAEEKYRSSGYQGRRVLVTGADGFIGSHLVEALVAEGARVTALSLYNSFDSFGWLDDLSDETLASITRVRVDIRDAALMRRALEGQEIVLHLAALIAIPHSYVAAQSFVETNILGTLNVLEAARENRVGRVVHTSTSEVYGSALTLPISEQHPLQGQSPYSASKIGADMLAESFVRSFDMPVVILRPFNTYGPRQSERAIIPTLIRQFLDQNCRTLKVGDTTTERDFTFVTDTVAAFMSAGNGVNIGFGRPYNAGSGKMISVAELIEVLAQIIGTPKPVSQEQERMRPGRSEVRALQSDSRRLFGDTGWRPRSTLKQGLTRTVEWWRDRLARGRVRRESTFMS
jgi:UDP-glucose 4-epimerase